jgi:hypothetical protein
MNERLAKGDSRNATDVDDERWRANWGRLHCRL